MWIPANTCMDTYVERTNSSEVIHYVPPSKIDLLCFQPGRNKYHALGKLETESLSRPLSWAGGPHFTSITLERLCFTSCCSGSYVLLWGSALVCSVALWIKWAARAEQMVCTGMSLQETFSSVLFLLRKYITLFTQNIWDLFCPVWGKEGGNRPLAGAPHHLFKAVATCFFAMDATPVTRVIKNTNSPVALPVTALQPKSWQSLLQFPNQFPWFQMENFAPNIDR